MNSRIIYQIAGLIVLCTMAGVLSLPAQDLTFSLRKISLEDGLMHRRVNAINQDNQGFIWMATPSGVQRYDGYGFRTFTIKDGLSTNQINQIWKDGDGMFWLVSSDFSDHLTVNSIDILNPVSFELMPFEDYFGSRFPFPATAISHNAVELDDGRLVFSVQGAVYIYKSKTATDELRPYDLPRLLFPFAYMNDGLIWGKMRIPGSSKHVQLLTLDTNGVAEIDEREFEFGSGTIATAKGMSQGNRCFYISARPGAEQTREFKICPGNSIQDLKPLEGTIDPNYLGFDTYFDFGNKGVLVNHRLQSKSDIIGPSNNSTLFDAHEYEDFEGNGILHVFEDRDGNLWWSTGFGAFHFSTQKSYFKSVLKDGNYGFGKGNPVRGLIANDSLLLVATELVGLYAYDRRSEKTELISKRRGGLRYLLQQDENGGFWHGRSIYDGEKNEDFARGKTDVLEHLSADLKSDLRINIHENAHSLIRLEDKLLVGTSKGLVLVDEAKAEAIDISKHPLETNSNINVQLLSKVEGSIWALTNKGLFLMDEELNVLANFSSKSSTHYLPGEDFRHVHFDKDGSMWLSTGSNGIIHFNPLDNTYTSITDEDGLPSLGINAIYADRQNRLWITTDNGLVCYKRESKEMTVFTENHGLPHNEFNRWSHAMDESGNMAFGGLNGLIIFNPNNDFVPAPKTYPLALSKVCKFDIDNNAEIDITKEVLSGAPIVMESNQPALELVFPLLSYEPENAVIYRWKIPSIHNTWSSQTSPVLRFQGIASYGFHELHLSARGNQSKADGDVIKVGIQVLRPWYYRWWAILLWMSLVVGLVYTYFQLRLQRIKAVLSVRERIAVDLHDEVGSALSSVALFSTAIQNKEAQLDQQSNEMLKRITENSSKALENMNDIVWSVNTELDSLNDVLERLIVFAGPIAESLDWNLNVDADPECLKIKLDMRERKNLYLIFKEAINNAAKHSQCNTVHFNVSIADKMLKISFADNGVGIQDYSNKNSLGGNGTKNMNKRATELKGELSVHKNHPGTLVKLTFKPQGW